MAQMCFMVNDYDESTGTVNRLNDGKHHWMTALLSTQRYIIFSFVSDMFG